MKVLCYVHYVTFAAGNELTIDYRYDRISDLGRQLCFCGAANCAKWIGAKKNDFLLPKKKTEKRKKAKKVEKYLAESSYSDFCFSCREEEADEQPLLLCDGKFFGQHCARGYHLNCMGQESVGDMFHSPFALIGPNFGQIG